MHRSTLCALVVALILITPALAVAAAPLEKVMCCGDTAVLWAVGGHILDVTPAISA